MKNKYKAMALAMFGIIAISGAFITGTDKVYASEVLTETGDASGDEDDYIYCVGSVSKMYATAAVMRLVDEGKIELDAPVTEYIPEFKLADERYKNITVRMLMDHTSGIMGTTYANEFLYADGNTIHHDSLLDIMSSQRLKADPGEYAAYCNDGFDLLELIVEHVSGMSYTEYITKYIAAPTGGVSTGTGANFYDNPGLIPTYNNFVLYENGICMTGGAGGVYATAEDVANLGAGFFTGNTSILTDKSKSEMAVRWGGDKFYDVNGLGWDNIEMQGFEEAGVKVIGKGGDALQNHAYLSVAPDEEISVAVLSNGGNSELDALVSQELMKIVMEERGIEINDTEAKSYEAVSDIPAEYSEYEGYYAFSSDSSAEIGKVSFPDNKYMHIDYSGPSGTRSSDYVLTTEGSFAELSDAVEDGKVSDVRMAGNPEVLTFVKDDKGSIYIGLEYTRVNPGIGNRDICIFNAEKIAENPVDPDVMAVWAEYSGNRYLLTNEIYTSGSYDISAESYIIPSDMLPGYIFAVTPQGNRALRIKDAEHAEAFQSIPSSSNRDLLDIEITQDETGIGYSTNEGRHYISDKTVPQFDGTVSEVELKTGEAVWFNISDNMANKTITVTDRPENSNIYVYNKYGEVVYTTHVLDAKDELPLPMGGKILFLGEDGGIVNLLNK
jgi:Beta-lactamase class C and other penicillin binding proteins